MVTMVCHGDLSTPREQFISIQAVCEAEQLVPQPPQPTPDANLREMLLLYIFSTIHVSLIKTCLQNTFPPHWDHFLFSN